MTALDRRSFLLGAGAAGVAGLAGCSDSADGTDQARGAAATTGRLSGTVTFTTWASDEEKAAFEKIAADFQAARGATVRIEVLPYDQIRTVVDRRLQAEQPPDLFRVSYTDVAGYTAAGVLADLSDYVDGDFGGQFLPALWDAVLDDDAPVGVPHHTDTSALVFDTAMMAKAGITSTPTSPNDAWSWDEFVAVLQKLRSANPGVAPFAFNYQVFGAYRWFNTLFQAGGAVLSEDLRSVTLDTPEARRALEWTQRLYTDGLHAPSVLVKRPTYPDDIFPTRKIAMIQAGNFLVPSLDSTIGKKFDYGVAPLMRDTQAAADLGGNAVVVTDGAKNKDAAAEFAKFLVTRENMQYFCEQTTVLPVRGDLVDAELDFAVRPDLLPVFQAQATTLPEQLVTTTTVPEFPAINQALVDSMDQFLSDPSASVDSVVTSLTEKITEAL
ncbi:MAG: ABC transporter substrate-binding protein [Phycicoccus sp.]